MVDVTVTFTDSAGNTASATATVIITDVNEAPSAVVQDGVTPGGVNASASVDENVAGAVLGEIAITDPDDGDTHTVAVDDDRFEATQDPNGGWWLKLKDDQSLDYEDGASVDVTVTVTDSGDLTATAMATVTVNNIDESPTAPQPRSSTLDVDENVAGDTVTVLDASDPQGDDFTFQVDDDRFEISDEGVLKLKDGVSLDHETVSSVDLELTATDDKGHVSSVTAITVTVNDVNEAPDVTGTVADVVATAGAAIKADDIDLLALFSDQDDGDAIVSYKASGAPSWLKFSVEYGTDEDGNDTITGVLTGTPPATADSAVTSVTITASDGEATGSASFDVILDDGNDAVSNIDLVNGSGNAVTEVEVDENNSSGVRLGKIVVEDQDNARHPNGTHLIQVLEGSSSDDTPNAKQDSRFEVEYDSQGVAWLKLKSGESLDHETGDPGAVDVTIRAIDQDGATNARGTAYTGNVAFQTITIIVNDKNDAPKAQTIGDWWVTVEDDHARQRRHEGQLAELRSWLSFGTGNGRAPNDQPAFKDEDSGDQAKLTYSLTGPSWLEIDKDTGAITNTKGGVPTRGTHKVTITATDPSGASDTTTFDLAVAYSDSGAAALTNPHYTEDNEEPVIRVTSEVDYDEGSGERRVATFTVTDDDNDVAKHPFALDSVKITAVVSGLTGDTNNSTDDAAATPMRTVNEAQGTTGLRRRVPAFGADQERRHLDLPRVRPRHQPKGGGGHDRRAGRRRDRRREPDHDHDHGRRRRGRPGYRGNRRPHR